MAPAAVTAAVSQSPSGLAHHTHQAAAAAASVAVHQVLPRMLDYTTTPVLQQQLLLFWYCFCYRYFYCGLCKATDTSYCHCQCYLLNVEVKEREAAKAKETFESWSRVSPAGAHRLAATAAS